MITIIAVGKRHESWVDAGIDRYQKRLRRPFDMSWILIPHSVKTGDAGADDESARIAARIPSGSMVVLLDERGRQYDSPSIARLFDQTFVNGRDITLIIGGAYGVSPVLRDTADVVWSLSPLVFPHQLVRLLVIEQLYRAQQIAINAPYHHQ